MIIDALVDAIASHKRQNHEITGIIIGGAQKAMLKVRFVEKNHDWKTRPVMIELNCFMGIPLIEDGANKQRLEIVWR